MPRVVHLGLGNFHRAHQAWYTARAGGWKMTGVIMSNQLLRDHLAGHDNEYILGIWGQAGLHTETISVYDEVLLATEQSSEIVNVIANTDTHVVTLTVTEKGYYLSSHDGRLDITAKPILDDLCSDEPKTAIGLLAAGIVHRANTGGGPLTVLSCDNLADNGNTLSRAVLDYLNAKNTNTVPWLLDNVSFPNSMVDRITPKLNEAAIAEIESSSGRKSFPVVGTEAFSEWIIGDQFIAPRPHWESAGAVFVADVSSYEERKLRLLNASHSYLAYAGLLAGHQYIHEAVCDQKLYAGVNALWDEATMTVSKPAADTLDEYRSALLDRFAVIEMRHELKQIAADGSLKLRERLVPILEAQPNIELGASQTCQAIAAWIVFVHQSVKSGSALNDPHADQLMSAVNDSLGSTQLCEKLGDLIGLPRGFLSRVSTYVETLLED